MALAKSPSAYQLPGSRDIPQGGIPLGDSINMLTAAANARSPQSPFFGMQALPRDPGDTSAFGPLNPLVPAPIDESRPDTGRPEPRTWQYQVGYNIPGNDSRLIPWQVLRDASVGVDILRRCIEIRKKHVRGLKWTWSIAGGTVSDAYRADPRRGRDDVEFKLREQFLPEINRLTAFWLRPWRSNGLAFGQWINGVMEDHLVLDAVAIYPRMTYGGDVIDLELIDGTTIKPLLDWRGARPMAPHAAFQQNLFGFPRGEFMADIVLDEQGNELMNNAYTASQLTYHRENFRTNSPYGMSATEQALLAARLYLKRQGWMLAEYDDGSTPLTWLVPDGNKFVGEQATPRQRRDYERAINDDLSGQTGKRHRVRISYPGYTPVQMDSVDERYKPDYDLHLIKLLASFYGVTIAELGFTEAKGLGSSGFHEGQADVQARVGLGPDAQMLAALINDLSHNYLNAPAELEFAFVDPAGEDEGAADAVADARMKRGTITLNDDRKRIGLPVYDFPEADAPGVYTGTGVTYIEGKMAADAKMAEAGAAALGAKAQPQDGSQSVDKPVDNNASADESQDEQDATKALDADEAAELERVRIEGAVYAEVTAYRRWLRKQAGAPKRPFVFDEATPLLPELDGIDPATAEFRDWVYVLDVDSIEKSYESWWPRDSHGRWMPRAHLGEVEGPGRRPEGGKDFLSHMQHETGTAHVGAEAAAKANRSARQRKAIDKPSTLGSMDTPGKTQLHADQQRIKDVVEELQMSRPLGFVAISDVRDELGDMSRARQDAALLAMARGDSTMGVRVVPIADRKNLTDRDRRDAIRIGNADAHALQLREVSEPEPEAPKPSVLSRANQIRVAAAQGHGRTRGEQILAGADRRELESIGEETGVAWPRNATDAQIVDAILGNFTDDRPTAPKRRTPVELVANAEVMFGSDRSRWPAGARAAEAKLKRGDAAEQHSAELAARRVLATEGTTATVGSPEYVGERAALRAGQSRREIESRRAGVMDQLRASAIEGRMQSAPDSPRARRDELERLSRPELDAMVEHLRRGKSDPGMSDNEVRDSLVRAVRGRHPRRLREGEMTDEQKQALRTYQGAVETLAALEEQGRVWRGNPNMINLHRNRVAQEKKRIREAAKQLDVLGIDPSKAKTE
jgi:hypothetical protein